MNASNSRTQDETRRAPEFYPSEKGTASATSAATMLDDEAPMQDSLSQTLYSFGVVILVTRLFRLVHLSQVSEVLAYPQCQR